MSESSDSYYDAVSATMRWLGRREYAQSEIRTKLSQRGFNQLIIERVLADLVREGWQSDKRYASAYTRSLINRSYGPNYIAYSLKHKQLAADLIAACLSQYDEDFWCQLATTLVEKKVAYKKMIDRQHKAKLLHFLQRRGYESQHVRFAIAQLVAQHRCCQ